MKATMPTQVETPMKPRPSLTSMRSGILQRKCACGGTSRFAGECEEYRKKRLQQKIQNPKSGILNDPSVPLYVHEIIPPGQPLDTETRAFVEPRFGHDFSHVPVHSDARATESARNTNALANTVAHNGVVGVGQFASGQHPKRRSPIRNQHRWRTPERRLPRPHRYPWTTLQPRVPRSR